MDIYRQIDDRDDYPINIDEDRYFTGASSYDCTGLIPFAPENEQQREAYGDIYPYLPEDDELTEK